MACTPVPNRALTLPSLGLGNSCSISAERLKNLFYELAVCAALAFRYLILIASQPDSKKENLE